MLLPKRTKRTKTAQEVTASSNEQALELNGCVFEGEALRNLKNWSREANPTLAGNKLSAILQKLGITGKLSLSGNAILTEDDRVVMLLPTVRSICGRGYPHISILSEKEKVEYSIRKDEELKLEIISMHSDDRNVDFHFPTEDNWHYPLIELRKDGWMLTVKTEEDLSDTSCARPILEQFLNLNVTEQLTPKEVYKILASYFNFSFKIQFAWTTGTCISTVWEVSITDGIVTAYMKCHLNENKDDWDIATEVNGENFRYQTDNVEFVFKNGKFTFISTSSNPYEDVFNSCKAEIAILRAEMKTLLD